MQVNLSRIDAATLLLTYKAASATNLAAILNDTTTLTTGTTLTSLNIYAVNYNVLRQVGWV